MPTLKQITCKVEWSSSNLPLNEIQTIYADGFVQTYVAVPPMPTPFSVHLRSHGYIAPGLAMFVYMDGVYQCNRNRSNLKTPGEARIRQQTEVDFQVRQKEELMPDGSFRGQQWRFDSLKTDIAAKGLAPYDAQYAGTIEVVVLRCYQAQTPQQNFPSVYEAEFVRKPKISLAADDESSSASTSDDESNSGDDIPARMPAMFDGAADDSEYSVKGFPHGGDANFDQPWPHQGNAQAGRSSSRHDQSYDTSDSQNWSSRIVADGNEQNYNDKKDRNSSSRSARMGNYEPSKKTSESQNRGQNTSATRSQRGHNSNDNNDRHSTSNRSHNSHTGSNAPRTSPSQAWVQSQGTPAQAGPAVVINVSHGTPQPGNLSSPANNQASNVESANVNQWQNSSQLGKIDEYVGDNYRSPEGSNASKASQQSNNSGVWPTQDYDSGQHEDTSFQQENAQWENTTSQEKSNENQWASGADAWNSNSKHGNSNNQQENYAWDNNVENSQPLESSNWETQNHDSGRVSNENNNVTNPMVRNANFESKNSSPENPSAWNQHAAGQGPQQLSSRSSYKTAISKPNWASEHSNFQNQGTTNYEAPQHVAPNTWAEQAVQPNNQAWGSPQQPTTQDNGFILPMFIDPRPRPYWSAWNQPHSDSISMKAEFSKVERTEPLHYVPTEVAQRNQMSHQVHVGQPAEYVHKRSTPQYMDDFDCPYAVFVFKYRSKAILEQILNITLVEPEAHEKERLQNMSKEELIEKILKGEASKKTDGSATSNSHTMKPEEAAGPTNLDIEAQNQRFFRQNLPGPPQQAVQSSESTNPEHHWGRGSPIPNNAAPQLKAKVASWLGAGEGGSGSGSRSEGGRLSGSQNYPSPNNGSPRNGSGGLGLGERGHQHTGPGDWNKLQGAGAWAGNDNQHVQRQTVPGAGAGNGNQHAQQQTVPGAGAGNGNQHAQQQTVPGAYVQENGDGEDEQMW